MSDHNTFEQTRPSAPWLQQSRRQFLKFTGFTSAGLVLGVSLTGCGKAPWPDVSEQSWRPDAFLEVTETGVIRFFMPQAEMGQGVLTGLTTLVAEELNIAPDRIEVRFAGVHPDYATPGMGMQITGGSASIGTRFVPLREAAARVKTVLLQAAALDWKVSVSELRLSNGEVRSANQSAPLQTFLNTARELPLPEQVQLKDPQEYRWIGKETGPRLDALAKINGTAQFGLDVSVPGMKRALIKHPPVIGSRVLKYQTHGAENLPGVKAIVPVSTGVAVVADYSFQARAALDRIEVEWELPRLAQSSSATLHQQMQQALEKKGNEAFAQGEPDDALAQTVRQHSAIYEAPYLAHATMEPMNCTVHLQGDHAELWVPTQAPDLAAEIVAEHSGLKQQQVTVHSTFLGGGFGRRAFHDFVAEATQIARQTGFPIQLLWSREEDMQHDYYRPAAMARLIAGLDEQGQVQVWQGHQVGPNILPYMMQEVMGALLPGITPDGVVQWAGRLSYSIFDHWVVDPSVVEGLYGHYEVPHQRVTHVTVDPGLRTGFWRSVAHSVNGFFAEGFMDELAYLAGEDPLAYRLRHLDNEPRLAYALQQAATAAGWGKAKPGRGLGLAAVKSFETYVAQVAEVSIAGGQIRVHRVVCAVDCGQVVNPDIVRAQMEGGIIFALSAALHGEITLQEGRVEQSNFDDYPMVRMADSPEIEVIVLDNPEAPTGVGEPGVPPLAPAVANAIFALTGKRLRRLPLSLDA